MEHIETILSILSIAIATISLIFDVLISKKAKSIEIDILKISQELNVKMEQKSVNEIHTHVIQNDEKEITRIANESANKVKSEIERKTLNGSLVSGNLYLNGPQQ